MSWWSPRRSRRDAFFGGGAPGGLGLRSGQSGKAAPGTLHLSEDFQEVGPFRRRFAEIQLVAFGQFVSVEDIGISGALANF